MTVPLVRRIRSESAASREWAGLPSYEVTDDVAHWIEAIATGVFSPLEGFQHEEEFRSVVRELALPDGNVWSVPIVFAPADGRFPSVRPGEDVLLRLGGVAIAMFHFEDDYAFDHDLFSQGVLGTTDPKHRGVDYVRRTFGSRAYAGKITLLERPPWGSLEPFRLDPAEARQIFADKRWKTVVGFQTTNPPHRGYEYIHRTVLELFDGLFIHPVVDTVRPKYAPLAIMKGYRTLIDEYYRPERVVLAAWRSKMFFAGPRDALHHAIVRRNFGCTHITIGRRHADTDGFYGDYDAWAIFNRVDPGRLGIRPLFFREVVYCPRCGTHVTDKVCPHADRLSISGSELRSALKAGAVPPEHAMRPEVAEAVRDAVIA